MLVLCFSKSIGHCPQPPFNINQIIIKYHSHTSFKLHLVHQCQNTNLLQKLHSINKDCLNVGLSQHKNCFNVSCISISGEITVCNPISPSDNCYVSVLVKNILVEHLSQCLYIRIIKYKMGTTYFISTESTAIFMVSDFDIEIQQILVPALDFLRNNTICNASHSIEFFIKVKSKVSFPFFLFCGVTNFRVILFPKVLIKLQQGSRLAIPFYFVHVIFYDV